MEEPRAHFKRQSGHNADLAGAETSPGPGADTSQQAASQGNNRRYRKKYARLAGSPASPKTTSTTPMHPMFKKPASTTTPRPASRPTTSSSRPAATPFIPKTAKATFFSPDFPGNVFGQAAVPRHGLTGPEEVPRTARQTQGRVQGQGQSDLKLRRLAFDPRTGNVHDEDTGQVFALHPVS